MSTLILARRDPLPRRLWRSVLRMKLALLDRRRYERTVLEHLQGLDLVVLPDVFNPVLLRSGAFLAEQVRQFPAGAKILDLGCGSGACGVAAAKRGCHVTAIDINPSAVRCTRANALLNDVALDVRLGDLFGPVAEETFDVILFNPPYYRGTPRSGLDHAWRSEDVPERFAAQLATHLRPRGYALLVLSTDGEELAFLGALERHALHHSVVAQRDFVNEVMSIYRVVPTCS